MWELNQLLLSDLMILAIPIITPDRKTWDVQYIEKEKQDFELQLKLFERGGLFLSSEKKCFLWFKIELMPLPLDNRLCQDEYE